MKTVIDSFADIVLKELGEMDNNDMFLDAIASTERMHVLLVCVFIMSQITKHEGHDPATCDTIKSLPEIISTFKEDFTTNLDHHLSINLSFNNLKLEKTHNEKTAEQILKDLENSNHNFKKQAD